MYVTTREGLGQAPMLYGSYAGTLGEPPLPPKVQSFLDRVKRSPQDYEAVILISILHPEPGESELLGTALIDIGETVSSPEEIKPMMEKVVQELKGGTAKLGWGPDGKYYRKLFDKEKKLIKVVADAFQKHIKEMETKYVRWFEEILTNALLVNRHRELTEKVGKDFVRFGGLPPEIFERVLNSRVPETHYYRLGEALRLIAEQRQKDNRAFKQHVEQERKKRGK